MSESQDSKTKLFNETSKKGKRPTKPLIVRRDGKVINPEEFRAFTMVRIGANWSVLAVDIQHRKVIDAFVTEPDQYNICLGRLGAMIRRSIRKPGKGKGA